MASAAFRAAFFHGISGQAVPAATGHGTDDEPQGEPDMPLRTRGRPRERSRSTFPKRVSKAGWDDPAPSLRRRGRSPVEDLLQSLGECLDDQQGDQTERVKRLART